MLKGSAGETENERNAQRTGILDGEILQKKGLRGGKGR